MLGELPEDDALSCSPSIFATHIGREHVRVVSILARREGAAEGNVFKRLRARHAVSWEAWDCLRGALESRLDALAEEALDVFHREEAKLLPGTEEYPRQVASIGREVLRGHRRTAHLLVPRSLRCYCRSTIAESSARLKSAVHFEVQKLTRMNPAMAPTREEKVPVWWKRIFWQAAAVALNIALNSLQQWVHAALARRRATKSGAAEQPAVGPALHANGRVGDGFSI